MRAFLESTQLRRVAFIILLGWFIPLTGILGVTILNPGGAKSDKDLKNDLRAGKLGDAENEINNLSTAKTDPKEDKHIDNKQDKKVQANKIMAANNSGNTTTSRVKTATRSYSSTTTNKSNQANTTNNLSDSQKANLNLLARVIHAEARGEPFEGQVAVGAVLLNRLKSPRFPNNLWGIIFKQGEFCTVRDGQVWMDPNNDAYKAARLALAGWDPTKGALYFYNPAKTTSRWIWSRTVTSQIGSHIFAR